MTRAEMMQLISRIDRPDHDRIMRMVKWTRCLPNIIGPISASIMTYLLLTLVFQEKDMRYILIITAGAGIVVALATALEWMTDKFTDKHFTILRNASAVTCFFAGLIISYSGHGADYIRLAMYSFGGMAAGYIGAYVILLGAGLVFWALLLVAKAYTSPIAFPVLKTISSSFNARLRNKYSTWLTSRGNQIITFSWDGTTRYKDDGDRFLVIDPALRRDGNAAEEGIPIFNLVEIRNSNIVNERLSTAFTSTAPDDPTTQQIQNFGGGSMFGDALTINPASGAPMMGGAGGVDVFGNPYGTDHSMT